MKLPKIFSPRWAKRFESLEKRLAKKTHHNVLEDLIAFTGLSREEVLFRIYGDRKLGLTAKTETARGWYDVEYKYHDPKTNAELAWFYCASTAYLFSNARRGEWDALVHVKDGPVLDFGGGVGQNVLSLAKRGFEVAYFEIGIAQREFVRFRALRHNVKIRIIDPLKGGELNLKRYGTWKGRKFGTILLQHVLEHIPKYQFTLEHLLKHLNPGGRIIEHSPFVKSKMATMHFLEKVPLDGVMARNNMVCEIRSHRKYKEPQVWVKKFI